MEIHCTRIGCARPLNLFPDLNDSTLLKTVPQRYCQECGMPLILDTRYIPVQLLRQGGFGTVFLSYDRRTPKLKRCIVKQLQFNPQLSADQINIATTLFHREAEVLETLGEHPRIPRFFAFLELEAPAVEGGSPYKAEQFRYLVQEYIEGKDLQLVIDEQSRLSRTEVSEVFTQMLKILEFIHSKGVIHRDVKPSNIVRDLQGNMHLIDFGAVKQIITTATVFPQAVAPALTGICTPEYAPIEQRQCSAIYPSSDLYALGVTCLHLLTGEQPSNLFDYQTYKWQWEKIPLAPEDPLKPILERMLQEAQLERFQSAGEVLAAFHELSQSPISPVDQFRLPLPKWQWIVGGLSSVGAVVVAGWIGMNFIKPPLAGSGGDRILLTDTPAEIKSYPAFQSLNQAGAAAMASQDYTMAEQQFRAALQKRPNSPETRLYLNNALIRDQPNYTVAVAIPLTDNSRYRSLEMLRGFAHAQEQINSSQKIKIKIEVFNDEDKPEKAESIAKALVDRPEILAVVGHNSSAVSLAAAKIYNDRGMPFIAPISTTTELTSISRPYIFRTNVRSDAVAKTLTGFMLNDLKQRRAAIFYVKGVPYSESLKAQFSGEVVAGGGEVVGSYDLSEGGSALQQAIDKGAETIVLFPTYKYREQAWKVLRDKQRRQAKLGVLGDIATLYSFDTLEQSGEAARDMVLGVSWHSGDSDQQFIQHSRELWHGGINWATATSYNAVQAVGISINTSDAPTRQKVQQNLASLKFPGASGEFQFFEGEARKKVTLVKVQKTDINYPYGSGTGQDFLPMGDNCTSK